MSTVRKAELPVNVSMDLWLYRDIYVKRRERGWSATITPHYLEADTLIRVCAMIDEVLDHDRTSDLMSEILYDALYEADMPATYVDEIRKYPANRRAELELDRYRIAVFLESGQDAEVKYDATKIRTTLTLTDHGDPMSPYELERFRDAMDEAAEILDHVKDRIVRQIQYERVRKLTRTFAGKVAELRLVPDKDFDLAAKAVRKWARSHLGPYQYEPTKAEVDAAMASLDKLEADRVDRIV